MIFSPRLCRYHAVFLAILCCTTGCPSVTLYTREQLRGADPARDLAASNVLSRLRQTKPQPWSVKGVRLLDPIQRAEQLWGKPSRIENQQGLRYIWLDPTGRILLRALLAQNHPQHTRIIQQIDIFSNYLSSIHPKNRALWEPKNIVSPAWRKNTFGNAGQIERGPLDTRYIYPQQGLRLLVFSRLIPFQHNGSVVLTLYRVQTHLSPHVTPKR